MATIYKVILVSHWSNYSEDQLKEILEKAPKQSEKDKGDTITVKVEKIR